MIELRLRNRAHPSTIDAQLGKQLTDDDYGVLLTGATRVLKPDGRPLAVYLPGALRDVLDAHPQVYEVLHSLRGMRTDNRTVASASRTFQPEGQKRARSRRIPSTVVGAADPTPLYRYCRLTEWTGKHLPEYGTLGVLLKEIAQALAVHVPDRYAAQAAHAASTQPEWLVPGTPFTTITVNNTYATGVHKDAGDLVAGFSCLAVLRRGHYDGGRLVFPEYRVAADMRHGDLMLMDAHDWHGNTALTCPHGAREMAITDCAHCTGERISVVCYYRERMAECGTADDEHHRAKLNADRRSQPAS